MASRKTAVVACGLLLAAGPCSRAHAQQPVSSGQPATSSGWMFNIAPYLWLPTTHLTLNYNLPPTLGGRLPTEVSSGPGEYLPHLDFGAAFAAEARKGPFSVLTDFMYMRFSLTNTNIKSLDFFGLPSMPISRSLQTSTGTTLDSAIWTLAGGYTVLQRDWGNVDVFAGFRLLDVNARTDYSLAFTVKGPRGNGAAFGGVGGISGSQQIWNAIAGVRGRVRINGTPLFIPYYVDIGTGGSQLTWQIATGLGYQTRWAAFSATYRYLSFEQGGNAVAKHMSLGGPMLMVDFSF